MSHNAAYRHFADRDALLAAVCGRCMERLAALMEQRQASAAPVVPPTDGDSGEGGGDAADAAWTALEVTGAAYVEFALEEPGWFRTAFAVPASLDLGPGWGRGPAGRNPYEILGHRLDALVEAGAIPPERRPGAEYAAWSAVHGLASLLLDGPLRDLQPAERAEALRVVLRTVRAGL